jgi:phenylalanyl-tRNA synthetase beta chain
MIAILEKIGFGVDYTHLTLTSPHFRPDIQIEADIAEEIARFHGYNNIKPTILEGKASGQGKLTPRQKSVDHARTTMNACGLSEIYTYSFVSEKVFDKIELPAGHELRNAVVISNPLGEDFKVMRTTMIPSILEALSLNYSHRNASAGLFEIGNVYLPNNDPQKNEGLPFQKSILTIGIYGGDIDFYKLKGIVEALMDTLKVGKYDFDQATDLPGWHPGRTAQIVSGRDSLGILGEIHPRVLTNFSAPERSYVAVIDLDMAYSRSSDKIKQYKQLPKYPSVDRDIALIIGDDVSAKSIESVILKKSEGLLEGIELFDFYKGPQVPEGHKSLAYSLTFRSSERTLTDEEVNKAMKSIVTELQETLGAKLR